MKLKLIIAAAVLQVLVLAFMAGQREWIGRTGAPLTLRTAPIDPNDPMRGAYVRLDYEIGAVPAVLCQDETAAWVALKEGDWRQRRRLRDRVVYAALKVNDHGIAELVALSDRPPAAGPFLRGRVASVDDNVIRVRYGIEALFMSKEVAQRTESMALKEKAGAPMAVAIAVGRNGTAVLKDFAWEPLGLTVTVQRQETTGPREADRPRRPNPRPISAVTATLHNYGDQPLAIVDRPDGRSFRLVPNVLMHDNRYVWSPPADPVSTDPQTAEVIVLKPGAAHVIHLDLAQRAWWVQPTDKPDAEPVPLTEVQDWNASFRLEYVPPSAEAVRDLPHADLIRRVPLRSRAFGPMQGID